MGMDLGAGSGLGLNNDTGDANVYKPPMDPDLYMCWKDSVSLFALCFSLSFLSQKTLQHSPSLTHHEEQLLSPQHHVWHQSLILLWFLSCIFYYLFRFFPLDYLYKLITHIAIICIDLCSIFPWSNLISDWCFKCHHLQTSLQTSQSSKVLGRPPNKAFRDPHPSCNSLYWLRESWKCRSRLSKLSGILSTSLSLHKQFKMAWRMLGWKLWLRRKGQGLHYIIWRSGKIFLLGTSIGLWRSGRRLSGQMKPKLITWVHITGDVSLKIAPDRLNSRLAEGHLKLEKGYLMIWGCILFKEVGDACKIDRRMNGNLYIKILEDDLNTALHFMTRPLRASSSTRTMILNTLARKPKIGSKTIIWKSYYGLDNLQTQTPLNTIGIIQSGSWQTMRSPLMEFWNFGREYKRNGVK